MSLDIFKGIEVKLADAHTEIVTVSHESRTFTDPYGNTFDRLPDFVRVVLRSSAGSGSLIWHEVWLPKDWNGIFIGTGNGGIAGAIRYGSLADRIRQGYAVANTDMGTSDGRKRGVNNPDVWKDFGWRATHIMTVCAKALIQAYYGRKEDFSYFIGESTGGEQAFSLAQRFPEDYDGILAGVPANNRIFLHTYFLWNFQKLHKPNGDGMFTDEEIATVTDCAVAFFQQRGDGETGDNFITFPYADKNTVEDFLAFLKAQRPTFDDMQLDALRAVYNGPVNPKTGEQIYNGMPIGSEIYGCGIMECQQAESPHFYPFIWTFGEGYDGRQFNFADDLDVVSATLSPDMNANDPDLTAFYKQGGKLLAFSGSADPCVPFPDAMKYYNTVCEKMGGYDTVSAFFRYFLLPGKDHGVSGKGVNVMWANEDGTPMLAALREWRENGKAPEYIVGARIEWDQGKNTPEFVRKVYRYKADKLEKEAFPISCDSRYLKE